MSAKALGDVRPIQDQRNPVIRCESGDELVVGLIGSNLLT